ncbi:MAG: serine/threonine protein kinase, partial [Planctomycetes bacterium]|nr:serine/threonine protein kinase [Planctomycetota bacterium]
MSLSAPSLPEQFGRYRILQPLGCGGMGAVYLAHDANLDREVALKVPHLSEWDDEARARFVREARTAATIRHPNICPIFDIGEHDGVHYLTMAYIPGRPLSGYLKNGKPLPARKAALLVRKIALALQAAHAHGIVHRDLKPSNVMIDEGGEPIVMDFGLARKTSPGDSRLTQSGAILGTPAYMSPEQLAGDPELIGPASDIYSLGVVLYELLTGRLPFEGTVVAVLSQIQNNEPEPPSSHRPGIDPELEAICLKAMSKDMSRRFPSMQALADLLAAWLKSQRPADESTVSTGRIVGPVPTIAMTPSGSKLAAPESRSALTHELPAADRERRRRWWLGGIAGCVILVAAGVWLLTRNTSGGRSERPPRPSPVDSIGGSVNPGNQEL